MYNNYKMKFYRRVTLLATLFFCCTTMHTFALPEDLDGKSNLDDPQQSITVSGKVTSSLDDSEIPGVNVIIKGTTSGTVTDVNGRYRIDVPSSESVLVFSSIGYEREEIVVGSKSVIDISLVPDITTLSEIVVVGYGEQPKATLTGAIEQIDAKVFEDRAVTNPALSLQGQTPGLVVTRASSRPGRENINLQIRGATSVNGGTPLIVIDGVPAVNDEAFYSMNPDDIESISVLKDGAASIYGSRAANGVLLVTTKRGATGKTTVSFTSNFRVNAIGIRPPTPTMQDYATVWLDATDQDVAYAGTAGYWGWMNRENLLRMQTGEEGIYPTQYWENIYLGNAARFDEMYGTAYSHQQNLSISGGTDKARYRFSLGFADNLGNLTTTYDGKKQYNMRLNYDYQLSDRIKLETGMSYFRSNISSPSGGLGVESIANDPPFFPAKNPFGQWYANFGVAGNRNAVANTVDGGREESVADQLKLYLAGTVDITDDLSFRATASIDKEFWDQEIYKINVPQHTWFGDLAPESVNPTSSFEKKRNNISYENYGAFLNYNKSLGMYHNIGTMIGTTAELRKTDDLRGYRQGFEDNGIYDLNVASLDENVQNSGGSSNWGFLSYIGRFNYNYKEKYLVELIGRRDGSSKFHRDYRWSNFGSVSGGWVLTEEAFMRNVPVLDFLKLKASYGEMGGQVGIDNHDYSSTIILGTSVFGVTPAYQTAAWVEKLTSFTRTWERIGMANYGVELRLLDHRLSGSFDYFTKKNDGMLIPINYPDVLGGEAPKTNSGVLKVTGWEAVLGWRSSIGELKYNITANMSDTRNELISMEGVSSYHAGLNATVQGYPLNSYFLYQTDGFFENEAAVEAYYEAVGGGGEILDPDNKDIRLRPGDTRKLDLDDNGVITGPGNTIDGNGDVKYMGDNAPHYTYGLNIGLQWKGFDLSTFFQGVVDQNVVRTDYLAFPFGTVWSNQTSGFLGQTWTEDNPDVEFPRMTAHTGRAGWNWGNNDFVMLNNRYIRMKTLVLGYTFNDLKVGNYTVDRFRVYFSGNDLFEFSSIKDGWDPESGSSTNNFYPFNRVYSLGLNIIF